MPALSTLTSLGSRAVAEGIDNHAERSVEDEFRGAKDGGDARRGAAPPGGRRDCGGVAGADARGGEDPTAGGGARCDDPL